MTEKKLPNGMKLIFAPGAFDNFDGTQEELDEFIKEIEDKVSDGTLFEASSPVDVEDGSWSDEELQMLYDFMEDMESGSNTRTLH